MSYKFKNRIGYLGDKSGNKRIEQKWAKKPHERNSQADL